MTICKNEGCNVSKEMSSANKGEGRRSPLIEMIENLSFRISIKVFDSQPHPPFDTKLREKLV